MNKHVSKSLFHIIAMSPVGNGLSGGDRIFIELARNFSKAGLSVEIITWKDGIAMCKREGLLISKHCRFNEIMLSTNQRSNFFICYVTRIYKSVIWSLKFQPKQISSTMLYSASDFWMDVIPGFILKLRFPHVKWVGTYYLAAPNPFRGFSEKGSFHVPSIKSIIYFFQQQLSYVLLRLKADFIFVTSVPDVNRFPKHKKERKYFVVKGGVDLKIILFWKKKIGKLPKIYDGVFMGRFHPQKGVLELVDIWKKVTDVKPEAKLIMIGDGPLMNKVKEKIADLGLKNNIILVGYQFDGEKKYKIFLQSKIFLHPVVYDSGGMSAAEGIAWGLAGVSFDLEALKTYYPKGFLKSNIGDIDGFAKNVLLLLSDNKLYEEKKREATDYIKKEWDFPTRANQIQKFLFIHE